MNRARPIRVLASLFVFVLAACSAPNPAPDVTDSSHPADAMADSGGDAVMDTPREAATQCVSDMDCADSTFCNGTERCMPGSATADARGCVAASPATPCAADETCDETMRRCLDHCAATGDMDGDGHRSAACGGDDCDDMDANRFPGRTEVCDTMDHDEDCDPRTFGFRDADMDGAGDAHCCNVNGAMRTCGDDCDDARSTVHPGLVEVCDGFDNDCNGMVDDGATHSYYADTDHDGYGDPMSTPRTACFPPAGYVESNTDCDDTHGEVHPGAVEACDAAMLDENCDGVANPASACTCSGDVTRACMASGACAAGTQRCVAGSWGGCSIIPVAESCNGLDDDCDGTTDEMLTVQCFPDGDNDGFALAGATPVQSCPVAGRESVGGCPTGQTSRAPMGSAIDCNDTNPSQSPLAIEVCNGIDDNCSGMVDEGVQRNFYPDVDRDGFGSMTAMSMPACAAPMGFVENNFDCDDSSAARNPAAPEVCDGVDNDCDSMTDEFVTRVFHRDADGDGFGSSTDTMAGCSPPMGYVDNGTDCNDTNASVHPGLAEVCDGLDNDCNGMVDDGVRTLFYPDGDRDGYGNGTMSPMLACLQPTGYAPNGTDCNDANANVHPGGTEICDGLDNNCNGMTDENTTPVPWYIDSDGDRFGNVNAGPPVFSCAPVAGRSTQAGDCNDGNAMIYPGTTCSLANSTSRCNVDGSCTLLSCNPNFQDCDGTVSNGCEVDLRTNEAHCGACSTSCGIGQMCCARSCTGTTGDVSNCGGCGIVCTGLGACCRNGVCGRSTGGICM